MRLSIVYDTSEVDGEGVGLCTCACVSMRMRFQRGYVRCQVTSDFRSERQPPDRDRRAEQLL
jgi:hypothetical protein